MPSKSSSAISLCMPSIWKNSSWAVLPPMGTPASPPFPMTTPCLWPPPRPPACRPAWDRVQRASPREGLPILPGRHLNDTCKLSEQAVQGFQTICMFFRCFQIFFFNSVKYFNKPKPCGFFLDALNVPPSPPTLLFWLSCCLFFFFQLSVHLTSVCGFCQIHLILGMFYP